MKMVPWRQYPVGVPAVTGAGGAIQRSLPEGPGDPRAQYIRSGPEGARGVLSVLGWSLCMFLSEGISFRLSSFCCLL